MFPTNGSVLAVIAKSLTNKCLKYDETIMRRKTKEWAKDQLGPSASSSNIASKAASAFDLVTRDRVSWSSFMRILAICKMKHVSITLTGRDENGKKVNLTEEIYVSPEENVRRKMKGEGSK